MHDGGKAFRQLSVPMDFHGQIVRPGDPEYDVLRHVADRRYDARPAIILRCKSVADVQAAIGMAQEEGLALAIRAGGNGLAGRATTQGGLIIDLGLMRSVSIDVERRTARVEPGALAGDVLLETVPHGLSPVSGTRARIGFVGAALFNGQGYLAPRYGNACDNVLSAELVLPDGRFVHASPDQNKDLFWAIRGSGDSFGVVTSLEVALFPVPAIARVGSLTLDLSAAAGTTERLGLIDAELSEDAFWGLRIEAGTSGPAINVWCVHTGPLDGWRHDFACLRRATLPIAERDQEIPYIDLYHRPGFSGSRSYVAGAQIRELDKGTSHILATLARSLDHWPSVERSIDLYPTSKGLSRSPSLPNAYSVRSGYGLTARSSYDHTRDDEPVQSWANGAVQSLVEAGSTIGSRNATALSHVSEWDAPAVSGSFGEAWQRIRLLKQYYDPTNLFPRSLAAIE